MQKANYEVTPNIYLKLILYVIIIKIIMIIFYFCFYINYVSVDKQKYEELNNYKNNLICTEVKICYDYYNDIFKDENITIKEYNKAIEIFDEYNIKK